MTQKTTGASGLGAGKAVAIAGVACAVLLGGIWVATSGDEPAEPVEVSQVEEAPTFEPYAPTEEEFAAKPEPKPVVEKPKAPREVVITESEFAPEDLSEWETEREKALAVEREKTVDDLPPEIREVVLDDLPGHGVYEPRLSLQKMVKKRRPNALQRDILNKLAWGERLPPQKIKLFQARNKNAKKAVDINKGER